MYSLFNKSLISLVLILPTIVSAQEPINLSSAKKQVIDYYSNGNYSHEINQVILNAKDYLKKRVTLNSALKNPAKLAIVLDIDETSLSNYQNLLAIDFSFLPIQIDDIIKKSNARAVDATRELYTFAQKNNVSVFFVTGRRQFLADATIKNLSSAGYNHWSGLYLKPNNYNLTSCIPFKSSVRKKIEADGYVIIENVGDQNSDLAGGYSERSFKLPNPFYIIN